MKCPRCEEALPTILCEECGKGIPERSRFCCWCGSPVRAKDEEADLSERVLCSDGSCIGVINETGVCNICGKPRAEGTA
jgi:hypothetical protein